MESDEDEEGGKEEEEGEEEEGGVVVVAVVAAFSRQVALSRRNSKMEAWALNPAKESALQSMLSQTTLP